MRAKLVKIADCRLEDFSGGLCGMSDWIWLQKHPTTPTKQSKKIANPRTFLGNDILKAAERPLVMDEMLLP